MTLSHRRCAARLGIKAKVIVVDFHAEATSEKVAMGWYLDGRVTAVLGTHTHMPTADERILHNGTAFQTDVGMSGPYDSIIGVEKELVLHKFLTGMPGKFEAGQGQPQDVRGAGHVRREDRPGLGYPTHHAGRIALHAAALWTTAWGSPLGNRCAPKEKRAAR
jgi:calcineurin-like phosphoesterase